jgi:hypothetical protein
LGNYLHSDDCGDQSGCAACVGTMSENKIKNSQYMQVQRLVGLTVWRERAQAFRRTFGRDTFKLTLNDA